MYGALTYFKDSSPMLEGDYPYTSAPKNAPSTRTHCLYSDSRATNVKVKDLLTRIITTKDFKATLQTQPISIAIAANN